MSDLRSTPKQILPARRALLRGAAVGAAAATPLVAMGQTGQRLVTAIGKGGADEHPVIVCSLSGWQSFQNAVGTGAFDPKNGFLSQGTSGETCGGYSPGWWGQRPNSPAVRWTQGMSAFPNRPYTEALPGGTLQVGGVTATMYQVMSQFPNTDDAHWLGAWLNAKTNEVTPAYVHTSTMASNFPFTSAQITMFYMEGNASVLAFIKAYLEIHTS